MEQSWELFKCFFTVLKHEKSYLIGSVKIFCDFVFNEHKPMKLMQKYFQYFSTALMLQKCI